MADVAYMRTVACPQARVRELLLQQDFLTRFVQLQHPIQPTIETSGQTGTATWLVSTEGIPSIFRGRIGTVVPVRLVIEVPGTAEQDGLITVDLEGKVTGQLRASLTLTSPTQAQTQMAVEGFLRINAGLLSGMASSMAREHLIVPILDEMADLLEKCNSEPAV